MKKLILTFLVVLALFFGASWGTFVPTAHAYIQGGGGSGFPACNAAYWGWTYSPDGYTVFQCRNVYEPSLGGHIAEWVQIGVYGP